MHSILNICRYGVALVGVRPAELPEFYEETILLNPGPRHIMKKVSKSIVKHSVPAGGKRHLQEKYFHSYSRPIVFQLLAPIGEVKLPIRRLCYQIL